MSTETEGFICPYCLVGFGTSSKLQGHFVEMHSGQGSLDELDYVNGEEEVRACVCMCVALTWGTLAGRVATVCLHSESSLASQASRVLLQHRP